MTGQSIVLHQSPQGPTKTAYEGLWLPDIPDNSLVACDTETSGLFVDDGARVSIVSIAWYDGGKTPGQTLEPNTIPHSAVYAFDQGFDTPLGYKTDAPRPKGKGRKKQQGLSLFDGPGGPEEVPNLDPDDYYTLLEWLESMGLVFHNAKFDLHILARGLRGRMEDRHRIPDLSRSVVWDTQVVNPVLWPEHPSSLKPTAERLFGEGEADLQRALQAHLKTNGYRFDLAPWSLVEPYAGKDSELTLRCYDYQQFVIDIGEHGDPALIREVAEREIDMAITLYRMESRGVGFDRDGALAQLDIIRERARATTADLHAEIASALPAYADRTPSITEHLMRTLWFGEDPEGLGLFPRAMTDGGTPSVAADVVRALADDGHPFAKSYAELVKLNKADSMWYSTWPNMVGIHEEGWHEEVEFPFPRLRTVYNQGRTQGDGKGGTVSGRLAVQRVQLQAIPQNYQIPEGIDPIRNFFVADEGYELWEVDLGQAEFRVAAGISKCQRMIDLFNSGEDVHSGTAKLMFNVDESHPKWKFYRQVAKRLNFGMLYGAGANTIRNQIEEYTGQKPPMEMLEQWLQQYRSTYPELGRTSRATQRIVERTRRLTLAGGRTRWFHPYEQEHKAFNQLIQGGVAEMMKVAMIDIEANLPGIMLLQIHDSIIVEVRRSDDPPPRKVRQVQSILVDCFEREFDAPFVTDAEKWGYKS